MKRIIIALTVFSLLALNLKAQTEEQRITSINAEKQIIDNTANSLRKVVRFNDSLSYKHFYYKGKELKMVHIWIKAVGIDKNVRWYFSNGKMIYSEQIWKDKTTGKIVDHKQFYLEDNKLFAGFDDGNKRIDPNSKDYKEATEGLAKLAAKLLEDATHF